MGGGNKVKINTGHQVPSLYFSGIQEEEMILSLEQTADVKPVKEELVTKEEEEGGEGEEAVVESSPPDMSEPLLKEEKDPEVDVMKLLTQVTESQPVSSLYDHLKGKPEALNLLAPAAGDKIISLDFSCPGSCPPPLIPWILSSAGLCATDTCGVLC